MGSRASGTPSLLLWPFWPPCRRPCPRVARWRARRAVAQEAAGSKVARAEPQTRSCCSRRRSGHRWQRGRRLLLGVLQALLDKGGKNCLLKTSGCGSTVMSDGAPGCGVARQGC